eukprot:6208223-Pleurochrysis_carterae.AAC.5
MGMHSDIRCWGDAWDMPSTRSAAMFNVVPVATIMETMIDMGLRAILRNSIGSSRVCNCE